MPSSPSRPAPAALWHRLAPRAISLFLVALMCSGPTLAYSVLTHEEIVDLLWSDQIRPLLLQRFPGLTDDQVKEAHAYAYGGAVIQDLGYYPFGSKEFSDLAHYVRSGDFVRELLRESNDVNEFAFALGALAHYSSDMTGHPLAVNRAVPIEYPKLRKKYGKSVTYAEDKAAHLKTEFGFDMVQVAKHRYAPQQYHDFIGFKVSRPLLDRTFPVVYGLELKEVIAHEDLAIGTYRFAVGRLIPEMTQVALETRKKEIVQEQPDFARKKFLYHLSRADYEKDWGNEYQRPGLGARILAIFFRLLPKIGPFKGLGFNNPTPQAEDLYFKSVNATVNQYRNLLRQVGADSLQLTNCDLDDGKLTRWGEYSLADTTYAELLYQLSVKKFEGTSPELRANILDFYSEPKPSMNGINAGKFNPEKPGSGTIDTKNRDRGEERYSKNLQLEINQLRAMAPIPAPADKLHPNDTSEIGALGVCSSRQ
jgi:hypothetical protein